MTYRIARLIAVLGNSIEGLPSVNASDTFRRLHAHGPIAKIPRRRRWRVTAYGHQAMGTPQNLRDHHFPNVYATAAAA